MILSVAYVQSGLTVYAVIKDQSGNWFNGTSFETYNASDWATYAQAATEQSGSGNYQITVPAALTNANYSATFYSQSGGSPAITDITNVIGSLNFTVSNVPAVVTPTDLVLRLRILANDTATSNLITGETPVGTRNGSNLHFRLQYQNIVSGSVYMTIDNTFRTQSGFSVDTANGLLLFGSAPLSTVSTFAADYNFQWFTDTDYTEFLTEASYQLSVTDAADVPTGLTMSLMQFALYYFWLRRATQYAHRYSSTGGQAGESVDVVTSNFRKLAADAMKAALQMRLDYYERQGEREAPSSATWSFGIDPYTPIR